MGTWSENIKDNDTFLDIYDNFFRKYNNGENPRDISKYILENFSDAFEDDDDKYNALFGLALAQWETQSLEFDIFEQVKDIIETEKDIQHWENDGVDKKALRKRQTVLQKFLKKISSERKRPKRIIRPKSTSSFKDLVNIIAPDGKKSFRIFEQFEDEVYIQTGSAISWQYGGGSIMYFKDQEKHPSARWLTDNTLEIKHSKDIKFTMKRNWFGFFNDEIFVEYIVLD